MNVPHNTTPEEYAKYYCADEAAASFVLQSIEDVKEAIADQEEESKRMELVEEQLNFAVDLIEQVQTIIGQSNKAKDIKAGINAAISNSMVEL